MWSLWTVCGKFLCRYDVYACYTVGVEGTPGRVPQYSDNAERITTVNHHVAYTVFVPFHGGGAGCTNKSNTHVHICSPEQRLHLGPWPGLLLAPLHLGSQWTPPSLRHQHCVDTCWGYSWWWPSEKWGWEGHWN